MKLDLYNKKAEKKGSVDLPTQFKDSVRNDLIKRAVLVIQSNARQPYGASEEAGKRHSSYLSKRRRAYKGTYGIGQSRTPRKVMSRNGTRFHHVGAFAPQTVGGRRAHPPKASKIWTKKLNKKENRKAIRSALSASLMKEVVMARGHLIPNNYPFALADDVTKISKTSELKDLFIKLGLDKELDRSAKKKVRAGKGKNRGRKYKGRTGILLVVSEHCDIQKAAANIPGCETILVNSLNASKLAPGALPGRVTLFTESAIKKINDEGLFI